MIVESKSISNRLLSVFMVILSLLIIQNACCVFGRKKMQKREKYVKPDFG
jgi:hypothetical protein